MTLAELMAGRKPLQSAGRLSELLRRVNGKIQPNPQPPMPRSPGGVRG